MIAAASRRASSRDSSEPSISRPRRARARRAHGLDRDRVDQGGRRRLALQARHRAREDPPPDDPGLDQNGRHQDEPQEGGNGAGRQLGHRLHLHLDAADIDDTRGRHALAQHLVDQHDQDGAEAGARDAAAAAEDAGAADDDGGDDDQLVALAVLAVNALVLGHVHEAGQGRAERGDDEGADAHERRVDAGIAGRQQVAADRIGLVAPARAREDEAADDRDDGEHDDLVVEAEAVRCAEREERIVLLGGKADVLAAGQAEHEAAADEQHGERGDEGRHPKVGDEHAVDQANRHSESEGDDDAEPRRKIIETRGDGDGKDHRYQSEGRPDR